MRIHMSGTETVIEEHYDHAMEFLTGLGPSTFNKHTSCKKIQSQSFSKISMYNHTGEKNCGDIIYKMGNMKGWGGCCVIYSDNS